MWHAPNKGDILNCRGKMPSLRRGGLPGSFNLPKQLPLSRMSFPYGASPCGEACYNIADTADIHVSSYVDEKKGPQFTGNRLG